MADIKSFVHPSVRYRLYFDETGNADLRGYKKDQNQRYLSLTGIVVRQDIHDAELTKKLTDLKLAIFGERGSSVILHRREIMSKEGVFDVLRDDKVRAAFDTAFVNLVEDLPTPIFTVSIDKQAHHEKYKVWQFDPYHYIMTCLLERFVLWLNANNRVGDVLGEARNSTHDGRLRRSFRYFYENGTFVRTAVIRRRLISKELKLELKTANIAALQIADLLAHPAHRNYKFAKLGLEIPDDYGTKLVRVLENSKYNRNPKNGNIEGYGRKWLP